MRREVLLTFCQWHVQTNEWLWQNSDQEGTMDRLGLGKITFGVNFTHDWVPYVSPCFKVISVDSFVVLHVASSAPVCVHPEQSIQMWDISKIWNGPEISYNPLNGLGLKFMGAFVPLKANMLFQGWNKRCKGDGADLNVLAPPLSTAGHCSSLYLPVWNFLEVSRRRLDVTTFDIA